MHKPVLEKYFLTIETSQYHWSYINETIAETRPSQSKPTGSKQARIITTRPFICNRLNYLLMDSV